MNNDLINNLYIIERFCLFHLKRFFSAYISEVNKESLFHVKIFRRTGLFKNCHDVFQKEFIFNSDDDVVAPRLTRHLHRTLLQPSNVQEVGIPHFNNQLAGWRKRMESEALRLDSSGSTVFSLFPLSMYQYIKM